MSDQPWVVGFLGVALVLVAVAKLTSEIVSWSKAWARLRRWLHCLTRLHRPFDLVSGEAVWIGCECGAEFYADNPTLAGFARGLTDGKKRVAAERKANGEETWG